MNDALSDLLMSLIISGVNAILVIQILISINVFSRDTALPIRVSYLVLIAGSTAHLLRFLISSFDGSASCCTGPLHSLSDLLIPLGVVLLIATDRRGPSRLGQTLRFLPDIFRIHK